MFAGDADRSGRHAHLAAADRLARLDRGFRNVGGADRAEQLAFRAGLGRQRQLEVLELDGARLRSGQLMVRLGLELVALRFELGDVGGCRHRGPAGGHQEIARIARLHLDAIADLAEVRDLLQQYDIHVLVPGLVLIGIRQQCQKPRAPDGELQLSLIVGPRTGDPARHDLAGFGDVALEGGQILVVDLLDVVGRESAELLAAEKTCHVWVSCYRAPMGMSSSSPSSPKSSWRRAFSSGARAIGEGSVTASSILTTRLRSTASLKRNEPLSSSIVF